MPEEPVLPPVEPPLMPLEPLLMPVEPEPVDEPAPVLCAKEAPASAMAETKIAIVVFFMSAPFPLVGSTRGCARKAPGHADAPECALPM
jgi:hypothetical protein